MPSLDTVATPVRTGRTVLLNPGPVNVHARVRNALTSPDECHREPEFAALMTRVRHKLTRICGGGNQHTSVVLTGSGTAALESAISSAVPPDGKLLVLDNGHYGFRLAQIAEVHDIDRTVLSFGWGVPIDLSQVAVALARDPGITHIGVVHHETSTGMLNPVGHLGRVVAEVGGTAAGRRRALLVDAISSIGAEPLRMDSDRVDWLVGSANKCLEGMPGLSFVCGRRDAMAALPPARSYYLDLGAAYVAQERRRTPAFTPAVQIFHALDVALDLAAAESVGGRHRRYAALAARLRAGLGDLRLRLLLPPEHRATTLTAVHLPPGVGYQPLHDRLREHGFVIYSAQESLAGSVFRLSTMGQLGAADIDAFLVALRGTLAELRPRS